MKKIRTYSELRQIKSFLERYEYLKLGGTIGHETFGYDRYLNQILYRSPRWRSTRNQVILRDQGCDLGVPGHEIFGIITVHHMNAITLEDIEENRDEVFDPEYLICTMHLTHTAIHYGDDSLLPKPLVVRRPNDTTPWRK